MNNKVMSAVIIDDEPGAIRALEADLLAYDDIVVADTQTSVGKARRSIMRHQPDIIFVDVEMPGTSGIELMKEMRPLMGSNMHVVFYTAYDKYLIDALRASAFDYLLKPYTTEELRAIQRLLPDKYFCNFSLFQSLPDSWAIDQIFPIMPIGRLDERPDRLATLQDITCDSDGKITNFITNNSTTPGAMPVHTIGKEPYYIGVFLVGAYQEILGDLHNLFGDTNAVHISVYKDRYEIDQIIDGETVAEVLDYVQFSPKKLVRSVEAWVTTSMKAGIITPEEGREFLSNYRSGLYGYTYLETD